MGYQIKDIKCYFLLLFILSESLFSQDIKSDTNWDPFHYFVGEWIGTSSGKSGFGEGSRTYEYIMDGTYLYYLNIMKFEPQEKNPVGEYHEDRTFFSYDTNRELIVARQFNIEGFINTYILDSLSNDHKTLILVSESSENAPPGLSARLVYNLLNENEFVESFELSFSNKDFSCWMTNHWTRKLDNTN